MPAPCDTQCPGSKLCTACSGGMVALGGACLTSCPAGSYKNGGVCSCEFLIFKLLES